MAGEAGAAVKDVLADLHQRLFCTGRMRTCGTWPLNMGNNVRRIVFEPQEGVDGGHSESRDWLSWEVSCLEITEPCGETCEAAMMDCVGLGVRGCLVENDD